MSDLERRLDALADATPAPAGLRRDHEIRRAIDAGLAAPAPVRPRRLWPWALAGATAAAALAIVFLVVRSSSNAPAIAVERGAIAPPEIGQLIEVSSSDRVVLRTPDDSTIEASALTRFARADRAATRWRLERGHLESHVTKRAPGQTFEVSTPEATVTVVGTRFSVDRTAGVTSVAVEEGVVRVTPIGGDPVTLHAGDRWPAPPRTAASDPPPAPPDEPATPQLPRSGSATHPAPARRFDVAAIRKVIRAGKLDDARKLIDAQRKLAHAAPDLAELGILSAEAELAGRQTRHAIELYLAVLRDYPSTPQAEQALFAAAQLAFDRPDAGYKPDALLRDYLDAYPHGQFAGDAKRLLDRAKN